MQCCDTGPPFVKTACAMHAVLPYKDYMWDMAGSHSWSCCSDRPASLGSGAAYCGCDCSCWAVAASRWDSSHISTRDTATEGLSSEALPLSRSPSWIMGPCVPLTGSHRPNRLEILNTLLCSKPIDSPTFLRSESKDTTGKLACSF
jgi:hypothetical protein